MLGGKAVNPAAVYYTGVTPGDPGMFQVNFRVPEDAVNGDLPLVLTIGAASSPAGGYLTVQATPQ
jgi:uncharacterized protein (TIGR03437 family)